MIVLDTHTWIWWIAEPEQLSAAAAEAIENELREGPVCISSISAWEIAQLTAVGRLRLTMDVEEWITRSEHLPFLRFIPIDNAIAVKSVLLPGKLHKDPADRLIIATTRALGARLVTKDERIRTYSHIKTIW